MPANNLKSMDAQALLALRAEVERELGNRRAKIEAQLARLEAAGLSQPRKGRVSATKGRKVAPKFRGPSGETWAGRGARPRWLVAALKGGKKLDAFLIDKPTRGKAKKRKKATRQISKKRATSGGHRRARGKARDKVALAKTALPKVETTQAPLDVLTITQPS
jgi:DNA-binding protein H-NS